MLIPDGSLPVRGFRIIQWLIYLGRRLSKAGIWSHELEGFIIPIHFFPEIMVAQVGYSTSKEKPYVRANYFH